MTAALALSIAPATVQSETPRERVQVLETRPGVREVLLVTEGAPGIEAKRHAVLVLGGGGGGFAVTSLDGVPCVHCGLLPAQRQRLANAIGGSVVSVSPPTDRPVMDRSWRQSEAHVADLFAAVAWTRVQWPAAAVWMLGLNNGALSAAVAGAALDDVAGAVLLASGGEVLDRLQQSERMRVLAVTPRTDDDEVPSYMRARAHGRETVVTVHDERHSHETAASATQFGGKEHKVMDVVARWILTGTAPDVIR